MSFTKRLWKTSVQILCQRVEYWYRMYRIENICSPQIKKESDCKMKITELKCPACGGDLKIDKENKNFAVCEYCNTSFALEWEHEEATLTGRIHYEVPQKPPVQKQTGWEPYGWKRGLALGIIGVVLILALNAKGIYSRWQMEHNQSPASKLTAEDSIRESIRENIKETESETARDITAEIDAMLGSSDAETETSLTGAIGAMAEAVFGKPSDEITDGELAKIQWIETDYDWDYFLVGYSFSNPFEDEDAELTWLSFSRDIPTGKECLNRFTGLKKLNTSLSIGKNSLAGLSLNSIGCYASSPAEMAELLTDTSQLKEIRLNSGVESLDGLEQFPNLESLYIDGYSLTDFSKIVSLPSLKSLTLESCDGINDFSVFRVMDSLEELDIDSENLKSLDFLSGMKSLKSLRIADAALLTLDGLEERTQLETLMLEDCDNLKNMTALESLTGLKELYIELPYNCPQPDLSGMTQLKKLGLSQFQDCSFLSGMTELVSLHLTGCELKESTSLANLTNMEELSLSTNIGRGQSLDFITHFPALKTLSLQGVTTYDDISAIFSIPTLRSLDISGMECEIAFDRLKDNPSLEELYMDGLLLYENAEVYGSDGFYSVYWDDVVLNEHTDFLAHFPSLSVLSIADNELTDIHFAENLPALEYIDLSDNFVTDLTPLSGSGGLQAVICTGNPVSNYRVLGDNVLVISE